MTLHEAAARGKVERVRSLLAGGAAVDAMNEDGQTPLMEAAAVGKDQVVKILLEAGADPSKGRSIALDFAVRLGNIECVRLLLEAGADPNCDLIPEEQEEKFNSNENEDEIEDEEEVEDDEDHELGEENDPPPLYEAVLRVNREMIDLLLKAGARIDTVAQGNGLVAAAILTKNVGLMEELWSRGASLAGALRRAIESKQEDLALRLLQAGVDPNDRPQATSRRIAPDIEVEGDASEEMRPLALAVYYGCTRLLAPLLEAGADLEHRDNMGRTALAHAVWEGRAKAAKWLLEAGASLANAQEDEPLLHSASLFGKAAVAKVLLNHGADPNERDGDGKTALLTAIDGAQTQLVQLLLEHGADPNAAYPLDASTEDRWQPTPGTTPLMAAVEKQEPQIVELLLKAGANVFLTDGQGRTAADYAVELGNKDILNRLKQAGAPIISNDQAVATHQLVRAVQENQLEHALQALEEGADAGGLDADGKSALTYAVQFGQTDLVRRLLDAGVNPNTVSKWGEGPLRAACLRHNLEIVQMLLQAGADVKARFTAGSVPADKRGYVFHSFETVLHDAATHGSLEILRAVLAAGADLQAVGESGVSPIMAAVNSRRMDSVEMLLAAGAKVSPQEETAFATYRFAERAKTPEFVAIVEELAAAFGQPQSSEMVPGVVFFSLKLPGSLGKKTESLDQVEAAREWGEHFAEDYEQLIQMAAQARVRFGERVRQAGYLLLDGGKPLGCGPMTQTVALLPTPDKYEAMFAFGLRGNDQELRCNEMVEWFRRLERDEPFELRGLRFDTVDIEFEKPVSDPDRWAREMAHFCHDLVGTDKEAIQRLADRLRSERQVHFWWD